MGKLFVLMGKSATGKDTVYSRLMEAMDLSPVVLYTTRPIRQGEQDGVTYHFCDIPFFEEQKAAGKVIENRIYPTRLGPWIYFTMDDGQINPNAGNYLMIGTLEVYEKLRAYFGEGFVVPLYLTVNDEERLMRAIRREKKQAVPHFDEVCRRYLADETDFSAENRERLGITKEFDNTDLETCCGELAEAIRNMQ